MPKRYNIVLPKKYTKNGEEKTAWLNVGKLVYFPASGEKTEGYVLELSMFPNIEFKIFPEREREQQAPQAAATQDPIKAFDNAIDGKGDIDPADIPF